MPTEDSELDDGQWPPARSEDEWLYFYLRGLSLAQVAKLCRVSHMVVRYSIPCRERRGSCREELLPPARLLTDR